MQARLILEDGTTFAGLPVGAPGERIGEVILNTGVVGYQEMVTDPANAGKILVLTYPHIGNYGVARKFNASAHCLLAALLIKADSRIPSNWQAEGDFVEFAKKKNLAVLSGVDTRTLAVKIRDQGQMLGIITTEKTKRSTLLAKLKQRARAKQEYISTISIDQPLRLKGKPGGPDIALLDLGVSSGLLKQLKNLGASIYLLPYNATAQQILKLKLRGLIISDGPEEDIAIPAIATEVRGLLGKLPLLGISTGHEVIGLALGGKLKKMKLGHHGVNYPVKADDSYHGEITVQNHSYVIDEKSIKKRREVKVTLRNLNDGTIEELSSKSLKFISTQYIPSSPGLGETHQVFERFLKMTGVRGQGSGAGGRK